ncbi:PP2C family protein-serine/threonine phosphatase [Xanthobacter sp. AM11]|uniref:PP2C family protein-serine/threonine phosphatase n=1 Tax=Xanthobacter sp. AM11 TaxID=3380643 RepID=UPI0039BEF343
MSAATPAPPAEAPLMVDGAMLTDPGRVRPANEDRVAYAARRSPQGTFADALAVVSDGMGGHAAGEVASAIAVEVVMRGFFAGEGPAAARLLACVHQAHAAIREAARENPAYHGMGATLTALAFQDNRAFLVHVGDSRAYLLRDGALTQISDDHTYVAKLVRDGLISPAEAKTHPDSHGILQAVGSPRPITPTSDPDGVPLKAGDRFILCSDGLTNMVEDDHIRGICQHLPPQAACEALIRDANRAGGEDNISVGVFTVGTAPPALPQGATRRLPAFDVLDARQKESAACPPGEPQ